MTMIACDYFLYDNRTWTSGIGRDWGIKAATGVLASRPDLRSLFDRYCGALPGDYGYLNGFAQALGGVRAGADGYLLCVTVETSDPFGRPSWAVYGLWCPGAGALENALASDPVGGAKTALGADTPPAILPLKRLDPSSLPLPRRIADRTSFRRFDNKASVSEANSLLLGAIRRGVSLPNILGVTASSRLSDLGSQFDVVYSHPLDDRSELALTPLQSDVPFPIVDEAALAATASNSEFSRWTAILWVIALLCAALFVAVVIWPHWTTPPLMQTQRASSSAADLALNEIGTQLEAIRALNPVELRQLIRPGDDPNILDAYEALIRDRQRIVGPTDGDTVADYYTEPHIHTLDTITRLQRIQSILNERPIGDEACRAIGLANPTVERWCNTLTKLEHTAQSFREANAQASWRANS